MKITSAKPKHNNEDNASTYNTNNVSIAALEQIVQECWQLDEVAKELEYQSSQENITRLDEKYESNESELNVEGDIKKDLSKSNCAKMWMLKMC